MSVPQAPNARIGLLADRLNRMTGRGYKITLPGPRDDIKAAIEYAQQIDFKARFRIERNDPVHDGYFIVERFM